MEPRWSDERTSILSFSSSNLAISHHPYITARRRAVSSLVVFALMSISPCSDSNSTIFFRPWTVAQWSGVCLSISLVLELISIWGCESNNAANSSRPRIANVFHKRVANTSERRTPLTFRDALPINNNGSINYYSIAL
jgi:hypothetical protein